MRNVTIIGAGTMGHGLALVFAMGGYNVVLDDICGNALKQAEKLIEANLDTIIEAGLVDQVEREAILKKRIFYTDNLALSVSEADFVIESIVEDAEAKKNLFAEVDKLAPLETILASNTSFLDIFKFVKTKRPEKVIITHWFAPPYIIPLVEIVTGPETSAKTIAIVQGVIESLGRETIVLNKFLPGFIANRLQTATMLEVYYLLDHGYATPEDIDKVAKASFGLRTPVLGLVKRLDYNGLDLVQKNLQNKSYKPPIWPGHSEMLNKLVSEGRLGVKTGRGFYDYSDKSTEETLKDRDKKLLKLKKYLAQV